MKEPKKHYRGKGYDVAGHHRTLCGSESWRFTIKTVRIKKQVTCKKCIQMLAKKKK